MPLRTLARRGCCCLPLLLLAAAISTGSAQYFGQNKVRYRTFEFKVLKTAHFDIYYYDEEREAAAQAGRLAERWYARISRVLNHDLPPHQPLIQISYTRPNDRPLKNRVWEFGLLTGF